MSQVSLEMLSGVLEEGVKLSLKKTTDFHKLSRVGGPPTPEFQ